MAAGGPVEADTVIESYTAVAMVNNDLVNIYQSGQLWMGEKFTAAVTSRSFNLTFPSTATGIKVRYALANKGTETSLFSIAFGTRSRSHYMSPQAIYVTTLEEEAQPRQSLGFDITYSPGGSSEEGYLDYIEMTGRVGLTYNGGQLAVRHDQALGHGGVGFRAAGSGTGQMRVWEVTAVGAERELPVADGSWNDAMDGGARQYMLFSNSSLRVPAAIEPLANQDLRGAAQADYVIVANPMFVPQAERLATLHAVMDGLSTLVVTDEEVYNEFSGGKADPMALRAFMRHLRSRHPDAPPRYLLLFGKATYDNRDLLHHGLPTVVTYETLHSFDDNGLSYCSDDMIGYLDYETSQSPQALQLGIGRLPARDGDEATHLVDKIEGYMTRRDLDDATIRGDWRNYIALLSDDADPSHPGDTIFVHSSEALATEIKRRHPIFNIDRLYADSYRQQSGTMGSSYPDLNNALRGRMGYGCLVLNYIGHGSQKYIGTERYIEPSDIATYGNKDRLPLMVTSTCSYGYHDKPDDLCGAELFVHAEGGAVAVISASRPISHIERFNTDLVLMAIDPANTIGDALRLAKNRTTVSPCIGLTGDPALRLARPMHNVVVTHIDGHPVDEEGDTATALSQVTVSGEIRDTAGNVLDDFDGIIYPIVFDRETRSTTLANDNEGTEVAFCQQKSIMYKGSEPVSGGRFTYTFTVPRDIPYHYAAGKLSHYAKSANEDAGGQYSNILFGGFDEDAAISETRPGIRLYMGDTLFRDGGITDQSPTLVALLSDSVGINAFGSGLGHDITVTIDGNAGSLVVLNDFYEADIDNPRCGTVRYTFADLTPGMHTLTLKAWNIWGYSSSATIRFRVYADDTSQYSTLGVTPNPAHDRATFRFESNATETIATATLQVYSAQGREVFAAEPPTGRYTVGPVVWDLQGVPKGIYLARIIITTTSGETHQSTAKCVVR